MTYIWIDLIDLAEDDALGIAEEYFDSPPEVGEAVITYDDEGNRRNATVVAVDEEGLVTLQIDMDSFNTPAMTGEMWELAGLCWDWYRLPGNGVGGPLHIVLDDMNVEAHHIEWCVEHADERPPLVESSRLLMGQIVSGLLALTEPERVAVIMRADGAVRPVRP